MRKLTASEFDSLPIKGKGRSSPIFNSILNLKEGEALLIERKDWGRKAGLSTLVRYIEKKHDMKFLCGALEGGAGWAVKRVEAIKKEIVKEKIKTKTVSTEEVNPENVQLKSDLILFYLSRIAVNKIERIEDTLKAAVLHFWKADKKTLESYLNEIINSLQEQGHIIIENDKTYIPLRNTKI
jgi:hypothetical protein